MGDIAGRAILDAILNIDEIATAFIAESKEGAAAEHTVEKIALHLMAGEIFAFLVFKIFTAVFHSASKAFDTTIIIP